jgi:transcriptional regulator with XRE-family HTH domain
MPDETFPGFKDRLFQARTEAVLTQDALASALGIKASAVGQWETGATAPSRKQLLPLAVLLNVNFLWLYYGRGPKELAPEQDGAMDEKTRRFISKLRRRTPSDQTMSLLDQLLDATTPEASGEDERPMKRG